MIKSPSIAYEASRVIKNIKGVLFGVFGYNSGAAGFIQIFDSATVPADGAAPDIVIAVGATSNFQLMIGDRSYPFVNGISYCFSSTGPTKTLSTATAWINPLFD